MKQYAYLQTSRLREVKTLLKEWCPDAFCTELDHYFDDNSVSISLIEFVFESRADCALFKLSALVHGHCLDWIS